MRWIKHPSMFCRSPAMSDVLHIAGPAGYGAVWLILERIAEVWDGQGEPSLRLSEKEWRNICRIPAKKLQNLFEILEEHAVIVVENDAGVLRLIAPILLELQDEWTSRVRKRAGVTPEQLGSHSGTETEQESERDKDRKTQPRPSIRPQLIPVLKRHGIQPDSERGRRLTRYVEQKLPCNPGGYLEHILQAKPHFDPTPDEAPDQISFGKPAENFVSAKDALRRMGFPPGE